MCWGFPVSAACARSAGEFPKGVLISPTGRLTEIEGMFLKLWVLLMIQMRLIRLHSRGNGSPDSCITSSDPMQGHWARDRSLKNGRIPKDKTKMRPLTIHPENLKQKTGSLKPEHATVNRMPKLVSQS